MHVVKPVYRLTVATGNEVAVNINGHLDAGMSSLFFHIDWAFAVAQKKTCKAEYLVSAFSHWLFLKKIIFACFI